MGSIELKRIELAAPFVFYPMWRHPDHPSLAALAQRFFGPSGWAPFLSLSRRWALNGLLDSPLLTVPSFLDRVISRLSDESRAGALVVYKRGAFKMESKDWHVSRFHRTPVFDTIISRRGDFRVCDLYAMQLSTVEAMPEFNPTWPQKKRDAAIAAQKVFLHKQGPGLGLFRNPKTLDLNPKNRMNAHLGNPVFIKEYPGTRPIQMFRPPRRAVWQRGENKKPIFGKVYKGEERTKQGRPQRSYHFIWAHGVERLPAEVLMFRNDIDGDDKNLTKNLTITIPWPSIEANEARGQTHTCLSCTEPPSAVYRTDKPLSMLVYISNSSGYEQKVPFWTEPLDADEIPEGISLSLQGPMGPVPRHEEADEPVKPQGKKTLLPGQSCRLFELDLNKHFRVTKSASYAVKLVFTSDSGLPAGNMTWKDRLNIEIRDK